MQLYKDFAAALPDAKLYGPDGVAETGFSDPKGGGVPADVAARVKVTVATLSPDEYPEEGAALLRRLRGEVRREEPEPVRDLRLRGESLTDYGVYTIDGGELKFDRTIKAATG